MSSWSSKSKAERHHTATKRHVVVVLLALGVTAMSGSMTQAQTAVPDAAPLMSPTTSAAPPTVPLASATDTPAASLSAELPHDLSPVGMFLAADTFVKAVMGALILASLLAWTIGVVKAFELVVAIRRARATAAALNGAADLRAASQATQERVGSALVHAACDEWTASEALDAGGLKERVVSRLDRIEVHAARRVNIGTGILATIGSIAPFVGLFGTVWGIMNSFIGISRSHTTNLAVVAPGIAEALLATALGLVAAIPAVVIYNALVRSIAGYKAAVADAAAAVLRLVSRDLDRAAMPPPRAVRR